MINNKIDFLNVGLTVVRYDDVKVLDSVISLHPFEFRSIDNLCKLPFFQSFNQESLYRIIYAYLDYCSSFALPIETKFVLDNYCCVLSISITYKKN